MVRFGAWLGRLATGLAVMVVLATGAGARSNAADIEARQRAAVLYRRALEYDARDTFDTRRRAVQTLEEATRLDPQNAEYQLALARLYLRIGFLRQSRLRYERVDRMAPESAEARIGLGMVWRRDYLKYLDRGSLRRAIAHFTEATRRQPDAYEAWLELVPLLIEDRKPRVALAAAEHAYVSAPNRPDGLLAIAHAAFRNGEVERADNAFYTVIPRLAWDVRERFLDIAPVATERDTFTLRRLEPVLQEEFLRRFWKDLDPDLATPANEVQLEYMSRVAQAYFLFFDRRRREWDQRGEVYVRYGPPEFQIYNPVGATQQITLGGMMAFPMNVLVWSYPSLGLVVPMQDRLLNGHYLAPISLERSTDPLPDPYVMEQRQGTMWTRGGRGVFPELPPGSTPLPTDGIIARFESESGPRLFASIETPGSPTDSLWAHWVVLDSARVEVARGTRTLSPSSCDPGALRIADFTATLPPGRYVAGLTVRDARGGRGFHRRELRLEGAAPTIRVSDLVASCAPPHVEADPSGQPSVQLLSSPSGRVTGSDPLIVYFELYHLRAGQDGLAHIELEYSVSSADADRRIWIQRVLDPRRKTPDLTTLWREDQLGAVRRQSVSVPVQSLPGGRYRLSIRARDLVTGAEDTGEVVFVKFGGPITGG